jgi:hypothetical protein
MATAARRNVDMVDMGTLIGSVRRFGLAGPPYEIVGVAAPAPSGAPQMRIHALESDEDIDYSVSDILTDPADD